MLSISTRTLTVPLILLLSYVSSAPTTASGLETNQFKVRSSSSTPKYDNLYLTSYHTGAGTAYAVLDADATRARTFVLNGTDDELQYQITDMITVDNRRSPEGFIVNTGASQGGVVEINAGAGTRGTYTTGGTRTVTNGEEVKFSDPQSGGWYGEWHSMSYSAYKESGGTDGNVC